MEIVFAVKGSAAEPYEVRFVKRSETNLSAYCTCPAVKMVNIAIIVSIS